MILHRVANEFIMATIISTSLIGGKEGLWDWSTPKRDVSHED
jgi:hypothetical protein